MIISLEERAQLQSLLDKGIITKSQFEKAISPVIVVSKVKAKILTLIKYLSLVNWKADIAYFKTKKLLIYIVITSLLVIGSWVHGYNKPKDVKIPVGVNEIIHVKKSGDVQFETTDGKVFHVVSKTDMSILKGELSPFGFQLKFIGVVGSSFGTGGDKFEGGAGISWFRIWKCQLNSYITNAGIYPIGISYNLSFLHLPNTSIGIAIGKGFNKNGETKIMPGITVNF